MTVYAGFSVPTLYAHGSPATVGDRVAFQAFRRMIAGWRRLLLVLAALLRDTLKPQIRQRFA